VIPAISKIGKQGGVVTALKTILFTIIAPGTVTVLVPYLLRASGFEILALPLGNWHAVGVMFILIGGAIYLWCAWDFTFKGKGTPNPDAPPTELVVSGLYKFVRNPMYVGVVSVVFGEAIWFESTTLLVYAVLLLLGFHLRVVQYEEPVLRQQFGEPYVRYCSSVPRWIPRRLQSAQR
jgi:protein-S-isoprenylcysteine O-methyltransferase Ste14